ncbi:unnamed protein product, partial [Chrysoparadoxa australica]
NQLLEKYAADLDKYPVIKEVEQKTGIPKQYLLLGASLSLVLVLLFGFGAGLLCNLVGFVYPAYCSFQAIETEGLADDAQWITYWVVYAFFTVLEIFSNTIIKWIPFYYTLKLSLLLWCMLPATQGASFLYESFLKDLVSSKPSKVDSAFATKKDS